MVFLNQKKYSCEACIKGHRSSTCKHTDRPLFEIKPKGRPVTQCEHCRELRKTKQVHVKCICEGKAPAPEEPRPKKKGNLQKVLASAAYPNGLPEDLEASVASHTSSDHSSDSERHSHPRGCTCKDDEECHCFTLKHRPRKAAGATSDPGPASSSSLPTLAPRLGSNALRSVLPKASHPSSSNTTEHHTPHSPRPHIPRLTHGNAYFSPYGRAYDEHYLSEPSTAEGSMPVNFTDLADATPTARSLVLPPSPDLLLPDFSSSSSFPSTSSGLGAVMCGCGDGCICPGCVEHRGSSAWFTRECANPANCATCFTSLLPATPPPLAPTPPTTPLGGTLPEFETLDQWISHIPSSTPSYFPNLDLDFDLDLGAVSDPGYTPGMLDLLMGVDAPRPAHCTGLCAPGQCTCLPSFFDAPTRNRSASMSSHPYLAPQLGSGSGPGGPSTTSRMARGSPMRSPRTTTNFYDE